MWDEIAHALPWTLLLVGTGTVLSVVIGAWLGVIAATRRGTRSDTGLLGFSLFTYAAPEYWLGILLILLFAVAIPIFPAGQQVTPGKEFDSWIAQAADVADHLVLPAATVTLMPHELSGGQRQRVAIAAALVLEPAGIVCDEPVSMLDVSVRAQILQVLLELRAPRGLALLFITHDLSLAWAMCDRLAVMCLGRVVEEGVAQDVIERAGHPYTRALVAAVRSAERRGERRALPRGELPDAASIPRGCRFHPRCPARFEPCDQIDPQLVAAGEAAEHRAACLLLNSQPAARP